MNRKYFLIILIVIAKTTVSQNNNEFIKANLNDSVKTQIMILGTTHLSQIDSFSTKSLSTLLTSLTQWQPDAICIEANNPASTALLGDLIKYYYITEIINEADSTLQKVKAINNSIKRVSNNYTNLTINEKKLLLLTLLKEKEIYTALLLWKKWNKNEALFISDKIDSYLIKLNKSQNENISIGVELAYRLNHNKIYHIDDNTEKPLLISFQDNLVNDLEKKVNLDAVRNSEVYVESDKELTKAIKKGDMLPYYKFINKKNYQVKDVYTQWHLFYRTQLKSKLDRSRASLWEVRNLNIAAHIRKASTFHQGEKILVVIGVSHKAFLDSYLSNMMDVKLININDL